MGLSRLYILILLIAPSATVAQNAALVKKQAQRYATASFNGDYKTVIDLTYHKLVTLSGGREEMQKLITERIESLQKQGIIKFDGSVDAPGKFYKAGTHIHCLVPETVILKMFNGHYISRTYLLAISTDQGKSWSFMDVGNMPKDVLYKLLPDYNEDLIIPSSGKPMFFTD
ncbi:hypothetical protein [Mucilaginibacter phyllosphaerae]